MAPSIALRIPHEPKPETGTRSLQDDVLQLVKQKGPFNIVTEQELVHEQALSRGNQTENDASENENEADPRATETQQQALERLYKTRQQMTDELMIVQQHIMSLIDTVSFAISSKSRIGETSISPHLRQTAPVGSVEVKQVAQRLPLRAETLQRYDEISTVTRAQAFKTAAEKLVAASKRLEDESQKQAQYWEQMAVLRSNGWPLSRLPSNDRLLILHFACGESGQYYQGKGAAMLRQGDSGNLILPGQVDARHQKVLSVTIRRKGVKTGRFVCQPQPEAAQLQIETDLVRAKESLFQEELFNEIAREARLIANLGVKIRSSRVEIELSYDCVAYVSFAVDVSESFQEDGQDQQLAECIIVGLRTLLIAEYEHKRSLRNNYPPQPLTQTPRPPTEFAILRPLLARLRHGSTVETVLRRLEPYQAALKRAGVSFYCEHVEKDNVQSGPLDALQDLRKIISTSLDLHLPTGNTVSLIVETYLGPPTFGTSFLSTTYNNVCGKVVCAQTSSTEDIISFVEHILAQEIATVALKLSEQDSSWTCTSQYPLDFQNATIEGEPSGIRIKCANGAVSLWARQLEGRPKSAQYSPNSARVSLRDSQQEETEMQLAELLRHWFP